MKPDVLGLRGGEYFTAPTGHIEKRSASPAKREAAADAQELAEALDDCGVELSDGVVMEVGAFLGLTPEQTQAAARRALRSGLLAPWE